MGNSARKAERERLEVEHFAKTVVSCPDCEVLCRRFVGYGWDGDLFDVPRVWVVDRLIPAVGLDAYLRQGIGVANGGKHRCPPTLNLVGDVMTLGAKEGGGGEDAA